MIIAYVIARWSVYILLIAPILFNISISVLKDFGISEDYKYYISFVICILIIKFLLKEKYSNINIEILNSSKRFENGIGLIFFGHFLLVILIIVVYSQFLFAFVSLPIVLFIIYCYIKGLSMTSEEIEKYKRTMMKTNQDNKFEKRNK